MKFDSNKEKNMLNLNIMRCDKITIKKIKILIPISSSQDEKYFLKLTTNDDAPQISKIFSFKNVSEVKLNQSFSLETIREKIIKEIKIELINQTEKISKYKASILNQNFILDEESGDNIIYLSDKKGNEVIIIYYAIEYKAIDSFEFFDKSVKYNERDNKNYLEKSKKKFVFDDNIKNEFIQNLLYIKIIIDYFNDLINWKNNVETLVVLISISFIILYFKVLYIYLLPLTIILFHIRKKNEIKNFLENKSSEENKNKCNLFYIKLQDNFNNVIEKYEFFVQKIFTGKNSNIIDLYKALILTVISNIFLFYFKLFYLIKWKWIFVLLIWIFFLSKNNYCLNFYYIINEMFSPFLSKLNLNTKSKNFLKFFLNLFFPLTSLYNSFSSDNSDTYISLVKSQGLKSSTKNELRLSYKSVKNDIINPKNNLIKFELYENERWWVIAGWTKNLIGNRPTWCKVDKPFEFCDKTKIFLPNDENNNYQWSADWKIEKNNNTDDNGWEYATDFDSEFNNKEKNKYVRRRKWVRYANKI